MSELTLFLIRIAYLAVLWIVVLFAIGVIRSDMFGSLAPARRTGRVPAPSRQDKSRPKGPTHVLVVEGGNRGVRAELSNAPIIIGRGEDSSIVLDDDYASTHHARIAQSGDQWFVEDLGSTNGTFISSVRLTQPTFLPVGTPVRIGKTVLELRK